MGSVSPVVLGGIRSSAMGRYARLVAIVWLQAAEQTLGLLVAHLAERELRHLITQRSADPTPQPVSKSKADLN